MADSSDIKAIVAAACAAAGPVTGAAPAWKMRVNELVPEIAALMSEGSRAWKAAEAILEADHISGVYLRSELEETSTRLLVTIMANNSAEEEHLRTPRTDTPEGKRMQNKLSYVKPGDRIHIWKVIEQMRNDPNKKVRYIGHFESYGPDPNAAPPKNAGAPPPRPVPPPGSGDPEGGDIAGQINALTVSQKIAVRNGANQLGVKNFMQPADDEERNTVLRLIKEQTG